MSHRAFNSDESQTDLLDRICDKGIVIAPWARVSMMEPGRVRVDHCQVTKMSTLGGSYENTAYDAGEEDQPRRRVA